MAKPDRAQTKCDGEKDVRRGPEPIAFQGQIQSLQAEGRKGGVAAADSGHESEPPFRPNEQSAFASGVSREKSDNQATTHVYEQGAVREGFAEAPSDHAR